MSCKPAHYVLAFLCALSACGPARDPASGQQRITVAAAANLTAVFDEIGESFTRQTGIEVTLSYASTAQLAAQIENGAPFDVYAAADTEHVEDLAGKGRLIPESRAVYARGQLALWVPKGEVTKLADLGGEAVRFIAIANPGAAPYGQAAVDALRNSSLWPNVEAKVVYAPNVAAAKQMAASGNADAALTAYSLVLNETGRVLIVDQRLHAPIDQAMGIVAASAKREMTSRFRSYLLGERGREILARHGYLRPL